MSIELPHGEYRLWSVGVGKTWSIGRGYLDGNKTLVWQGGAWPRVS